MLRVRVWNVNENSRKSVCAQDPTCDNRKAKKVNNRINVDDLIESIIIFIFFYTKLHAHTVKSQ